MWLMLLSCVFWRNNISVGSHDNGSSELHISSTIRYLHVSGPSIRAQLNPNLQQIGFGWEFSPALLFGSWIPVDEIQIDIIQEIYLFSGIGVDFLTLNFRHPEISINVMSPYVQIHTPAWCPISSRDEMFCMTSFVESQYHISINYPNHTSWNIGISGHYGRGIFPF